MALPKAIIKDIDGDVNVTRNGETVAVKTGDFLLPGDQIVTGATGLLALEFPGSEGQVPAAGIMHSNGKMSLGEQEGVNGQQIVVQEDGECFEFTGDLADNSAAVEGGTVSGLFGAGLLGAGGASIAGAGAVAAGAFVASDSGGSGTEENGLGGNGGGGGIPRPVDVGAGEFSSEYSPQSIPEFINENLTPENLENTLITPIENALDASQQNPSTTPENIGVAVEQVGLGVLENVHDALVATTGEGTIQADLVQQLVDGINQTPLGEPLSPVTTPVLDIVNTDLGLDTIMEALPDVNPLEGGLVTQVVSLADDITQPLSQQSEPFDNLMDVLKDVGVETDHVLDGLISQVTTQVPNQLEASFEFSMTDFDELGSIQNDLASGLAEALPSDSGLADLVQGILGGTDSLQSSFQNLSGGDSIAEGDLLGTLSSGISSGADSLGDKLGGSLLTNDHSSS